MKRPSFHIHFEGGVVLKLKKIKLPYSKEFIWGNIVLFLLIVFTGYSVPQIVQSAAAQAANPPRPIVIVDPGHGGVDGGASTADGTAEKGINLAISLSLRDFLKSAGYEVVMTRETDVSIHDDSASSIRQKKVSDLHNRLKIAQNYPDAVFVSIHQNQFEQAKYSGCQIFFSKNNADSERLAQKIDTVVKSRLQPGNTRELKQGGKNLFLLWNIMIPTVMVECGFLSNPHEAELLCDEEYQKQMAFAIFCGIEDYVSGDAQQKPS